MGPPRREKDTWLFVGVVVLTVAFKQCCKNQTVTDNRILILLATIVLNTMNYHKMLYDYTQNFSVTPHSYETYVLDGSCLRYLKWGWRDLYPNSNYYLNRTKDYHAIFFKVLSTVDSQNDIQWCQWKYTQNFSIIPHSIHMKLKF